MFGNNRTFDLRINLLFFACSKYLDGKACAYCADQDQMQYNEISDQGLHYLPFIQKFLDHQQAVKWACSKFKTSMEGG